MKDNQKGFIVPIIILIIAIIVGAGYIFLHKNKDQTTTHINNGSASTTMNISTLTNEFDFLRAHYVLTYQDHSNAQELYEFIPQNESIDAWLHLVTVVKDEAPRTVTDADLDNVVAATVRGFSNQGADLTALHKLSFVNTAGDITYAKYVYVYTVAFFNPNGNSEVDVKKMYLNNNNEIVSVTYGVKLPGATLEEVRTNSDTYFADSDVVNQFLLTAFPQPWTEK